MAVYYVKYVRERQILYDLSYTWNLEKQQQQQQQTHRYRE